jgi:RNA polymerase sigma-70 factor (ECF subfamily)
VNHSDVELVDSYLKGDETSLRALVNSYLKPVHGYIFQYVLDSAVAEELTQETFLKVWKNLRKYDRSKSFKTWLFQIAKNTAIDYLRKNKELAFSELSSDFEEHINDSIPDNELLPDEIVKQLEHVEVTREALKKISADYRVVIMMHYVDGLSLREIADLLGESSDTVKSRHRRALQQLKSFLHPNL